MIKIIQACTREAGTSKLLAWGVRNLYYQSSTEDFLYVVAPDESDQDVRKEIGCLVKILALNVAMGDSSKERKGFKR